MVSENIIREIARDFFHTVTPKPSVGFKVLNKKAELFDCKLGGLPYFPINTAYPKTENGRPMLLLSQINFEKIPHIPDFPKKGILQFFILPDVLYGSDLDDLTTQKNFRVIYHKDIITDEKELLSAEKFEEMIDSVDHKNCDDFDYMPFDHNAGNILEPVLRKETYSFSDVSDSKLDKFIEFYNRESGENIEDFYDLFDMKDDVPDPDALMNNIAYELSGGRFPAFIGGYSEFTLVDPRTFNEDFKRYDTVLFELLSSAYENADNGGSELLFGDFGTGTFLIPRDKLLSCDFTDVLYNYDFC